MATNLTQRDRAQITNRVKQAGRRNRRLRTDCANHRPVQWFPTPRCVAALALLSSDWRATLRAKTQSRWCARPLIGPTPANKKARRWPRACANICMASAQPALRQVAEQAREFLGFFDDETQQPVITELLTALDNAIVRAGGAA